MKNILHLILITAFLNACSTNYDKYDYMLAEVHSVKKIHDKDKTPKKGTAIGAGSGAGVGIVVGGIIGAAATIGTLGLAGPVIPVFMATGAATGGAIGGTAGYIYDYKEAGSGLYEYKVLTEDKETIIVRQIDDEPFKVGETVKIIWEEDHRKLIPIIEEKCKNTHTTKNHLKKQSSNESIDNNKSN